MIIKFLFVVSLTQLPIVLGTSGCWDQCTDYHRVCPAIKDPSRLEELAQEGVAEHLPKRELPTPVNCDNVLYTALCPHSCGACVSCSKVEIDGLRAQMSQLEDKIAALLVAPTPAPTTLAPIIPERIEVVTGFGSKCLNDDLNNWDIQMALDQKPDTTYHSHSSDNPWAKFYIPKSKVTNVKVKNRGDCCGDRLTGGSVWVCEADSCEKCGMFGVVGNGEWVGLSCGGDQGLQGSFIKVTVPANVLQISEIEVSGAAEKQIARLRIKGAISSPILNDVYPLSGSLDNNAETCYHSKDNQGWAKYEVAQSYVTLVRVQNRFDCCNDRLMGAKVFVCADGSDQSCQLCGTFEDYVGLKQWGVISCGGDGIQGRFVKVMSSATTVLQIAEIEIFGNVPLPTSTAPIQTTAIQTVTAFSSKILNDDLNNWGLQRATDGNGDTIYHSHSANFPWARFFIPMSVVTSVKIKNRADCCGDRMTGESVMVCDADYCLKCGAFGVVGNGEWGTMTCGGDKGFRGSFIEVTVPSAALQIAEIQISGEAKKQIARLTIKGATSSPILNDVYPLSGSLDNNAETCYHSKDNQGWAKYEVAQSYVTLVRVQNRFDCCDARLLGAKVFVCADGSDQSCQLCGTFHEHVGLKQWGVISCGGEGIQGRFVKVMSSATTVLQIAEIEIFGNMPLPASTAPIQTTAIQTLTAFSSKILNEDVNNWGLQRATDGNGDTIYHSHSANFPWARFFIPMSVVTTVKIKNRADCCGDRMTGESVMVCDADYCFNCGAFGVVGNGEWGTMTCGGDKGFRGSFIEVSVPSAALQIAEIQIFGEAEKQVSVVNILGSTSSPILNNIYPLSASLDNNDQTCFHSKDNKGWAKYEIAQAYVTLVAVLNRHDCCNERLMGAEVFVCADQSDQSCKKCGEFSDYVGLKQWGVVSCGGEGIQGRFVKVMSSPSTVLQINQIQIYSNVN